VIKGYAAVFEPDDVGLPLTAFISIKPFDAAAPDDLPQRLEHPTALQPPPPRAALPQRLEHLTAIEACHSVAGDENYILKVRVTSPAALEDLLQQIRTIGGVSTRTTVVLSTPYENRPPDIERSGEHSTGPDGSDPEGPLPDPDPHRAGPDGT